MRDQSSSKNWTWGNINHRLSDSESKFISYTKYIHTHTYGQTNTPGEGVKLSNQVPASLLHFWLLVLTKSTAEVSEWPRERRTWLWPPPLLTSSWCTVQSLKTSGSRIPIRRLSINFHCSCNRDLHTTHSVAANLQMTTDRLIQSGNCGCRRSLHSTPLYSSLVTSLSTVYHRSSPPLLIHSPATTTPPQLFGQWPIIWTGYQLNNDFPSNYAIPVIASFR